MRRAIATTAAALAIALFAVAAGAQTTTDELAKEIDALKQGQQEIQRQLEELKKLIQARPAAAAPSGPNVAGKVFNLAANPVKGDPSARLTLIEFLDYQ